MKKILLVVSTLLILCGCNMMDMDNTPKKQVEKHFNSYQILDQKVLDSLDSIVEKEDNLTTDQKDKYRDILKKHYEKLDYEIKDETINGNNATVKVEIEVNDYTKTLREVEEYKMGNPDEFVDSDNNYSEILFQEYRLEKLKDTKDRVKYTLYITLTKKDDKWVLDTISESNQEKILGIYQY